MKHFYKQMLAAIFICAAGNSLAQNMELRFRTVSCAGSDLVIAVEIKSDVAGSKLGDAIVSFDYEDADIAYTSSTFTAPFNTGVFNNAGTNIKENDNELTLSLDYTGAGGTGATIGTSYIEIARISFDIYGNTANTANFTWRHEEIFDDAASPNQYTVILNDLNNTPLPVELIYFNVLRSGENSAILNWATASEENNKGFYIERSADGKNWYGINFTATQAQNGNSNSIINYNYIDGDVFRPFSANNTLYYRIRQQDYNGTEEYVGGIKAIRFGNLPGLQFGPNPATSVLNISVANNEKHTIAITNIIGKLVFSTEFEGNTFLDVENIKPGTYIVTVKNALGKIIITEKLLIQH